MKVEKTLTDTKIHIQHIMITVKENYHPPLVWIEVYRPRKDRYDIAIQLNGNEELADAFEEASKILRKLLKK
ncbi:MAG: hypothetical protein QXG40_06905 [Ignisphaera sp.]